MIGNRPAQGHDKSTSVEKDNIVLLQPYNALAVRYIYCDILKSTQEHGMETMSERNLAQIWT